MNFGIRLYRIDNLINILMFSVITNAILTMGITAPPGVPSSITLSQLAARFIQFIYVVIGIVFFAMIVYAGFTWLTSAGNPDKTKQATQIFTSAIVGAAIALAAGAITGLFETVFGIRFT
jgi:uncharacterized BrkB/YihY/UPF0761 family membrane protein